MEAKSEREDGVLGFYITRQAGSSLTCENGEGSRRFAIKLVRAG